MTTTKPHLKTMSQEQLLQGTLRLAQKERKLQAVFLHYIMEVEDRLLYAELGYPSMFAFCTQHLGYSDGAAQRRILAMRLLRDDPRVSSKIASGQLTISTAAYARAFIRRTGMNPVEIVDLIDGKSQKDAQIALLTLAPHAIPEERVRMLSPLHTELQIVLTEEFRTKLENAKALLSHSNPYMNYTELLERLTDIAVEKILREKNLKQKRAQRTGQRPRKNIPIKGLPKRVPMETQREVWKRDGGCCTYVNPETGVRCGSNRFVEVDHIQPRALGGGHDIENLRLLCRAHNQLHAKSCNLPNLGRRPKSPGAEESGPATASPSG